MDLPTFLPALLLVGLIASASPGPATLSIAATSMAKGSAVGLRLALGVLAGSLTWSVAAATGLSAIMIQFGWFVEAIRYLGAAYLLYLAIKSLRSAWKGGVGSGLVPERHPFLRGMLLHLTNPKAIFFFGALYTVVLAPDLSPATLFVVVIALGLQSAIVFLGYAFLFSRPGPMALYRRFARWINAASGLAFGALGLRLLTVRLE